MNYLEKIIEMVEGNDFFNRAIVVDKETTLLDFANQVYAFHTDEIFFQIQKAREKGGEKFLVVFDTDRVSVYPIDTEEQIKKLYDLSLKLEARD